MTLLTSGLVVLALAGIQDSVRAARWLFGILLLTAAQVYGISAEALKIVAFELNAETRALLGFSRLGHDALALAYQFGYLILPPVAPIVIWLAQFRASLAALTGWSSAVRDCV